MNFEFTDPMTGEKSAFSLTEAGWLRANIAGKKYEMAIISEMRGHYVRNEETISEFKNYHVPLHTDSMECLMEAYRYLKEDSFSVFDDRGNRERNPFKILDAKEGVIKFLDRAVFNTPESRELLNEYLYSVMTQEDIRRDAGRKLDAQEKLRKGLREESINPDARVLDRFKNSR